MNKSHHALMIKRQLSTGNRREYHILIKGIYEIHTASIHCSVVKCTITPFTLGTVQEYSHCQIHSVLSGHPNKSSKNIKKL